jgi:hypothetical protein
MTQKNALKSVRITMVLTFLIMGFFPQSMKAQEPSPNASKGFGISISPSIIRLTGKPGESQSAEVRVYNKSQKPMQVFVEANDLGNRINETGELIRVFLAPGTLPYSCAKWILLHDTEFVVPPGEYKDVHFLMASPQDASGGSAAVIFFRGTTLDEESETPGETSTPVTSVQIQPRLGVLVFLDVTGTINRTGNLQDFSVIPPAQDEPLKIRYVFENAGNADILVEGSFYVLDQNHALVVKENLNPMRTFPGDRGASQTIWEGVLQPGKYHLVASYELGPDSTEAIVREADFTVS